MYIGDERRAIQTTYDQKADFAAAGGEQLIRSAVGQILEG